MAQGAQDQKVGRLLAADGKGTVHILLGSKSDLPVARKAVEVLDELEVSYSVTIASAHRTPDLVERTVRGSGAKVFIGIAGLSAALPGVIASHTLRPVIGVPVSGAVNMDSVLSVVQMPPGVPVGAVGLDRGENAALLAARIVALSDEGLGARLEGYNRRMREKVMSASSEVRF